MAANAPVVVTKTLGQPTPKTRLCRGSYWFEENTGAQGARSFDAGNRKTWSWSGWLKPNPEYVYEPAFFGSRASSNNRTNLYFRLDRCLQVFWKAGSGGSDWGAINTREQFRDPTAWYHVLIVWDTKWGKDSDDRVIIYVNGTRQTIWTEGAGMPSQNMESQFGESGQTVYIGADSGSSYYHGYLTNMIFLDGIDALPGDFGFFDPDTGAWKMKDFEGGTCSQNLQAYYRLTDSIEDVGGKTLTNNNSVTFETAPANSFGIKKAAKFVRDSNKSLTIGSGFAAYEPYTIDFFCKFDNLDDEQYAISFSGTSFGVRSDSGTYKWTLHSQDSGGTYQGLKYLGAADTNWHHVRIVTYPQVNGVWIDGVQQNMGGVYPRGVNVTGATQTIGGQEDGSNRMDGYICGVRLLAIQRIGDVFTGGFQFDEIKGDRLSKRDVGPNGAWLALDGSGTDTFKSVANLNEDLTGMGHGWGYNNAYPTWSADSPSGVSGTVDPNAGINTCDFPSNYAVWNGTWKHSEITLENGMTKAIGPEAGAARPFGCTFGMTQGKWYWEIDCVRSGAANNGGQDIGIAKQTYDFGNSTTTGGYTADTWACSGHSGNFTHDSTTVQASYAPQAFLTGTTVMCALDMDNGRFWLGTNGTWGNNGTGVGDPANGTNPIVSSGLTDVGPIYPYQRTGSDHSANNLTLNAGQQAFSYQCPKGFLPMCSANVPCGLYRPKSYFDVGIGTAVGAADYKDLSFRPDLLWAKRTDSSTGGAWFCYDSVRGPTKELLLTTNDQEVTETNRFMEEYPNGFKWGEDYPFKTGDQYAYFGWAGGFNKGGVGVGQTWGWASNGMYPYWIDGTGYSTRAAAGLDNGSNTLLYGASVSTVSGFSNIYAQGVQQSTIDHGLGKKPEFILAKRRNGGTADWAVYHKSLGAGKYLILNSQDGEKSSSSYWNDTEPTDTVFTVGNTAATSAVNDNLAYYCWTSIPGFSAFGYYESDFSAGDESGAYIWTGFKPAFLIIKRSSSDGLDWWCWNWKQPGKNVLDRRLIINGDSALNSQYGALDLLAGGFKIRNNQTAWGDGGFVYAAWAAQPYGGGMYGAQANAGCAEGGTHFG